MKFKKMKFWIGEANNSDKELCDSIITRLTSLGYCAHVPLNHCQFLFTEGSGLINGYSSHSDPKNRFVALDGEQINIDWMRSNKRKTVEIGGKRYYEDDLAEALSKIKEADDID